MHALTLPRSTTSVAVPVLAALAAIIPWLIEAPWWAASGLSASLLIATVAAATDLEGGRIPDRVVVAALVPTLLVGGVLVWRGGIQDLTGAGLGLAVLAVPLLIIHLVDPRAMGFGDVKLAAALGAALGLVDWRAAVLALCVASGVTAAVAVGRRRSTVPFGPGLVLGAVLALLPLISATKGLLPWR